MYLDLVLILCEIIITQLVQLAEIANRFNLRACLNLLLIQGINKISAVIEG